LEDKALIAGHILQDRAHLDNKHAAANKRWGDKDPGYRFSTADR
jgi:hypothetical protein